MSKCQFIHEFEIIRILSKIGMMDKAIPTGLEDSSKLPYVILDNIFFDVNK